MQPKHFNSCQSFETEFAKTGHSALYSELAAQEWIPFKHYILQHFRLEEALGTLNEL